MIAEPVIAPTTPNRALSPILCTALIFFVALAGTLVVLDVAWISDDAYITARYADNLLNGYGPVFNAGERVQGYTHPLWFGLFAAGLAITGEPVIVASVLGAAFTFLTIAIVGAALFRLARDPRIAVLLFGVFAVVVSTSESWRSFQTGGLENPLTHLLIALTAIEVARGVSGSSQRTLLYGSLLILTRPDLALLVGPLGLVVAFEGVRRRRFRTLAVAAAPLVLWYGFAVLYYGTLVPNNVSAKVGIFTLEQGVEQGLRYVWDWIVNEPASALVLLVAAPVAVLPPANVRSRLLMAGVALYLIALVVAGGDFMRGRMILPIFFTTIVLAVLTLARTWVPASSALPKTAAVLAASVLLFFFATPAQDAELNHGIINERWFYDYQTLSRQIEYGTIAEPFHQLEVRRLTAFEQECGHFAIHYEGAANVRNYLLGPGIDIIDIHGLTDAYIANLPRSSLVSVPRPGHPTWFVPLSYLGDRTVISIFEGWRDAVRTLDCSIVDDARALRGSSRSVNPEDSISREEARR